MLRGIRRQRVDEDAERRRAAMASWSFPGRRRGGARRGSPSMAGPAELLVAALLALCAPRSCLGNPDAKRLYDDLMSSYNRLIRPVSNNSDRLTVRMGLKLSQLIDVVRFATCAAPIRRLRDVHRRHDEREERTPRKPSSVARTRLGLKKWTHIRCPCPIHVSLPRCLSVRVSASSLSPVRATLGTR